MSVKEAGGQGAGSRGEDFGLVTPSFFAPFAPLRFVSIIFAITLPGN